MLTLSFAEGPPEFNPDTKLLFCKDSKNLKNFFRTSLQSGDTANTLSIMRDNNVVLTITGRDALSRPREIYLCAFQKETTFLISTWSKGAHSEELLIHAVGNQEPVYSYVSSWPIELTFEKNQLRIFGKSDLNPATSTYQDDKRVWRPK